EDFEDESRFNDQWQVVNEFNDASKWQISKSASTSGGASLFLNSFGPRVYSYNSVPPVVVDPGFGNGDIDEIISPSFDLSKTTGMTLNFNYSYANYSTKSADITEALKIYYSKDCGQNWTAFNTPELTGIPLVTAGYANASFVPNSSGLWK